MFGLTTLLLAILMVIPGADPPRRTHRHSALLILSATWLVAAALTLIRHLAPYHYEVLHHYCPWCLFLPEHGAIGFALLFLWGLVAVEAPAQWLLVRAPIKRPELASACGRLLRASRYRLLAGLFGFVMLAVGPALWWRWQFGLWIDG